MCVCVCVCVCVCAQVHAKLKGCVVYTSSAAAALPSPSSVLYAATKAYIAALGAGLAAEVRAFTHACIRPRTRV